MTTSPERIRRYRILSELGHGAMGRVYLAEDPRIDRKIALKVLSPRQIIEPGEEEELRERFLVEARAAGRLIHPGIVMVFDADTDPESGDPYLAMEWVDGRTLRDLLAAEGRLETARAVDLVAQVAATLDYAHRNHVIHRDIKPANLLVTADGVAKVTDFGIAKLKSQSLTLPGYVLGSPHYMAPEQVKGEPVDGRADLFSLGVVLYECLTGELAFSGDSLADVTFKIVAVDPQPPEIYHPAIPPSLSAVLDRALRKEPEERFQTGAELERDLRAVAGELDGRTRRPEVKRPGRTRSAAAETVDPEGATIAMTRLVARPGDTEPIPRETPRSEAGKRRGGLAFVAVLFVVSILAMSGWRLGLLPEGWPSMSGGQVEPSEAAAWDSGDSVPAAPDVSTTTDVPRVSVPESPEEVPPSPPCEDRVIPFKLLPELLAEWEAQDELLRTPANPRLTSAGDAPEGGATQAGSETAEGELEVSAPSAVPPASGEEITDSTEPRTSEAATEKLARIVPPPPRKPPAPIALMEIVYENRLKAAYISVRIDGSRKLYDRMEARSLFKRTVGQEFRRILRVPTGRHVIEVHVSGVAKKKIEVRQALRARFSEGEFKRLVVKLKKGSEGYEPELTVTEP